MEGKILVTVILLALAIALPGCGFMGVTHARIWEGGPEWWNITNQKWSISTEELPSAAIKHFRK